MANNGTNILWYNFGAQNWNEALPLGNGRLGAMIFGEAKDERICLNEDTLWSGYPQFYENPDAPVAYLRARELAMQGKYPEAQDLIEQKITALWSQCYLPLGDLRISVRGSGSAENHTRSLDLSTGIHLVKFNMDGIRYERETFVSAPDQVMAIHLTCDKPASLNFEVSLLPALRATAQVLSDRALIEGNAPVYIWQYPEPQDPRGKYFYGETPETSGMGYRGEFIVRTVGGTVYGEGGSVKVTDADEAYIYFNARTSFRSWDKHPVLDGTEYKNRCETELTVAADKGYDALKVAHIADVSKLFNRTFIDLGGGEEKYQPTDERLYNLENGASDPALYALYFNFGKYLTIAASREGTQATNLQGIWNYSVMPPWNCNYTVNINTEMNYWPTLALNLPECQEPLIRLIAELSESGERTAKEYYNAPGSVSHHNTDLWRMSTPVGGHMKGSAVWSFWPMSGGWFVRHLWERYDYLKDTAYLKQTAWPLMKKCAEFYLSILIEDENGHLIIAPSTSPENSFFIDGEYYSVTRTTAMTQSILRDVFEICLKTEETLSIEDEIFGKIRSTLPRLRPLAIGQKGELLEWSENMEEAEVNHRHLSNLYGLYPGHEITPQKSPELADACRVTLTRRGDESTGWAMGWRINCWATLRDGDHALKLLNDQLRTVGGRNPKIKDTAPHGGTYLNLFDAHPPFQIDGNYGACAGIIAMLMQPNDDDSVEILPALPSAWKTGEIRGLRGVDGKIHDIFWDHGKVNHFCRDPQ